jgi:hypothetical protein
MEHVASCDVAYEKVHPKKPTTKMTDPKPTAALQATRSVQRTPL